MTAVDFINNNGFFLKLKQKKKILKRIFESLDTLVSTIMNTFVRNISKI